MKRLFLAVALTFTIIGGCTSIPSSPSSIASTTVLDEKAAIGIELAYTAAAKGATVAIRSGLVTNPAAIIQIRDVNEQAYDAVKAVRAAYKAGNSASYASAFTIAQTAIANVVKSYSEK